MPEIVHITDQSFENDVLKSDVPVLVDVWAEWCAPCRMVAPVVEAINQEYNGEIKVGKLDVDAAQTIAMRYGVMGIPTLGLFQGGKMVDRLVGYPGPGGVKAFVEKNVSATV